MKKIIKLVLVSIVFSFVLALYSSIMNNISLDPNLFSIVLNTLVLIQLGFLLAKIYTDLSALLKQLKAFIKLSINQYSISIEFKEITFSFLINTYISNIQKTTSVMRC